MRIDDARWFATSLEGRLVMPKFTSKDVARLAGVSQSTVSYVMSGKRPISEETRERVQEAIARLTYEPNAGARALASQRTSVIGLVIPFHTGADAVGQLPFIQTITSAARARDHEVLLVTSDEGSAGLRRLAGRSLCDAIILMDVEARDERVPVAASLSVPVVLIGVPHDPAGLFCVDLDFAAGARMAVGELAATGHDHLAVVGYPAEIIERDMNFVRRFMDAFEAAAAEHRLPYQVIEPVELGRAAADAAVKRLLASRGEGLLGLVVPNSPAPQPVLHALNAHGVVPGRDISVVALCADATAKETEPPVTNVSLEPRDVSRRAMETLFWLLDPTPAYRPPAVDLLMPRLTRRATTLAAEQG
jgi:DNA-binding LacI/PurR family transcriptional regulator